MINQYFQLYGFDFDENTTSKFERFLELFKEKNSQVNLSSLRDDSSIVEKHFVDSLMLTKYFNLSGKIADIGTGGGFPLLPLAIANGKCKIENDKMNVANANNNLNRFLPSQEGQVEFYGIDSVGKKLKAIDEFSSKLGLDNVYTIHSRLEEVGQDKNYRETFDFVLSRATAYFPTLLEYAIPLLKVGGIFIAYKLDNSLELEEGKKALKELDSEIIDIKKYSLAGTDRTLVFIKKNRVSKDIYPRSNGLPLKKPII